jgi:hypothetical protein
MSRREEIDKLTQVAYESEDLPTLERTHAQFEQMLQSMRQNVQATADEDVRNLLTEMIGEVESTDEELRRRIAQIKVDMLDPSYASRQAEKARERAAQQAQADEMARKIKEGIGGFLGGLGLGNALGLGGSGAASAPASTPAPPTAAKCGGCGAQLSAAARFCPECGTPVVRERRCASCGVTLEAGTKFCPDCGTRAS